MKKSAKINALCLIGIFTAAVVFITGCGQKNTPTTSAPAGGQLKKVTIGNFGTTCEAPLFAAYENGYFKEEGLDVELIKGEPGVLKDSLATNKIDATDGVLMQWIKPAEQGLDVKFTAGIHTGCLQVLVPANSDIKTIQDFKGKTIGVTGMGGGPMNMVSRMLSDGGVDFKNDVAWKVFPAPELEQAMAKGEVDIISLPDPVAQMIIDKGVARSYMNMAVSEPYSSEYCCLVVVTGKLAKEDPAAAAAITRGFLKGAKWVAANPQEAAKLIAEKKYVPGDVDVNAKTLASYNYVPSVEAGQKALQLAAKGMKDIGILEKSTDTDELANKLFLKLPGVE
ncbi:MAG: putative aliphatic sulfonates-binding protein precursor [Pelotomaculum sp. PtaU1.Bin035]|nr:MAG: putative aliphatic sulfonates-binding protein precursor [Pelotomaculum sp. PtaU1.Bin035]